MPKDITRLGTAENGMTVSLRYEASKVGTEIMEKGGNAIDAAVATAFAQFVCLPEMCGIGGGGLLTFILLKPVKPLVLLSVKLPQCSKLPICGWKITREYYW